MRKAEEIGGEDCARRSGRRRRDGPRRRGRHGGGLEGEYELELAKIVRRDTPALTMSEIGQQLGKRREKVHALQRKEVDRARGLRPALWQGRWLRPCGGRPRLGIEADHAFLPDIGHGLLEVCGPSR